MLTIDEHLLESHFKKDLGIKNTDLVFVFSGIWGLGKLKNGLDTITEAFKATIPEGLLIVPTFSYSWNEGNEWDPKSTECPKMGAYANSVWKSPEFTRSNQPNFSVAALQNNSNDKIISQLFDIDNSCFGEKSIFGNIVNYSLDNQSWIMLLGGAFNDCLFRCTFIHYVQQKLKAPHRYEKKFYDPKGTKKFISQFVRYNNKEEYLAVNNLQETNLEFPLEEDFSPIGEELKKRGLLLQSQFGFYPTRMVKVSDFCKVFEEMLINDPWYCVK